MQTYDPDSEIKKLVGMYMDARSRPDRGSHSLFDGIKLPPSTEQPPPARFVRKVKSGILQKKSANFYTTGLKHNMLACMDLNSCSDMSQKITLAAEMEEIFECCALNFNTQDH